MKKHVHFLTFQALVNVRGEIVCKENCGSSVSVTLVRLGTKSNKERTLRLTDEHNKFTFSNVFPGKYRIEVEYMYTVYQLLKLVATAKTSCIFIK